MGASVSQVRESYTQVVNTYYHLQFTAKQLNRQAAKAGKDELTEKAKLKKVYNTTIIPRISSARAGTGDLC